MTKEGFPTGWNDDRVRLVLAHYEAQSEDDAAREDESGGWPLETMVSVPRDLLAEVRELIAKRQG